MTDSLELLRKSTQNPAAEFRTGQLEAIQALVANKARLLVIEATGWGKSTVYFIAAKLLRERGLGLTLLVSPLLALMRNQLTSAARMGIKAATLNSGNVADWAATEAQIVRGDIDILLVSPERLHNTHFANEVLPLIASRIACLVIDEAHCISDWGHDFRPDYRYIAQLIPRFPPNLRILATTATANNRVVADLEDILGPKLLLQRGSLARPSLALTTLALHTRAERFAWLAEAVMRVQGSGIIYTLTIRNAEYLSAWLQSKGVLAKAYHSQLREGREALEDELLANDIKVLVSTVALGMGFDKPDLAFVFHEEMPGSVVHYYQQVGRAGRNGNSAQGIMLYTDRGKSVVDFFINNAFPRRDEVEQVLDLLERHDNGLRPTDIESAVNLSKGRIGLVLKIIGGEVPAPVVKENGMYKRTAFDLSPEFWTRVKGITALRQAEHEQMKRYAMLEDGHMVYLIKALDGDPEDVSPGQQTPATPSVSTELVQEAASFLKQRPLRLDPRKRWPASDLPSLGANANTNIPKAWLLEPGFVLSAYADGGWGTVAMRGKHESRFDDSLVGASANLIVQQWHPEPKPTWVTCMPSRRHPLLVRDFAVALAAALGLPFVDSLVKTDDRAAQKTMQNSAFQAKNLDGALEAIGAAILPGPLLLIDDMVDSGWTFTVAGCLLRRGGSGPVYPFALASTANH